MAKDKLTQYDSTASNNTDVGGISVAEGMLPSGVNNAIREQMSHLADFAAGTSGVDVLKLQDDTDTNSIKLQAPSSVTTTTTFTLPDGDGSADQVLKTDGSGQLGWADRHANPSLIINGAMTVSQRGTSQASVGYNGGYFAAPDRFRFYNPTQAVWTLSQSTEAPDGFSNSYKIDCTTADTTVAADHTTLLEYRFEGQDLQHLKKGTSSALSVTASFWVRSAKTGTYILEFRDGDNNRSISKSYTVSSADTWEYKTITFDGDTTGTLDNDNANSMSLLWWLAAGSDYTSGTLQTSWGTLTAANQAVGVVNLGDSTSNDWHITGVKLEVGSTATDFVHRSYGEELALCQRYYQASEGTGYNNGFVLVEYQDRFRGRYIFPVTMRADPTVVTDFTNANAYSGSNTLALSGLGWGTDNQKPTGFRVNSATQSTTLATVAYMNDWDWTADAEL